MSNRKTHTVRSLKRRLRRFRNRIAERFFDTRYGRELLVNTIGPRVLTMTVDCDDHLMTVSPSDYIGQKVFRKGHFERDRVDHLLAVMRERGLLKQGADLLELGGNIGTQTVYFALSKAFRRIVTVEPDPRNFPLLSTNISQNGLSGQVIAVQCAAGDREGDLEFFLHRNNRGKSSAIRQSPSDEPILVPVRTVPAILDSVGGDIADIGLIWMDIEGYEPVACRSMGLLMARGVPLYMEFTPHFYGRQQAADFVRLLESHYEDCHVFFEDRDEPMKVAALPLDHGQFDVLFFSKAR